MARADRRGAQLAFELPPELLERLRARAAAERRTVAALLRGWIEAGLAAGPAGPAAPGVDLSDLSERVGCLERELALLRRPTPPVTANSSNLPASPNRVIPAPLVGEIEIIGAKHLQAAAASPERVSPPAQPGEPLPLPQRRLTPAEAAGLLTTPEVGKALGLSSDSALTNWIAREASKRGGSAVGGIYRGHRLRGKGLLPGGQKPGWLWEPA
jgi:hypothetical protein